MVKLDLNDKIVAPKVIWVLDKACPIDDSNLLLSGKMEVCLLWRVVENGSTDACYKTGECYEWTHGLSCNWVHCMGYYPRKKP